MSFVAIAFITALVCSSFVGSRRVVSNNGTTDNVLVNGITKLTNPNGRTLMLERDDDDSWVVFHDPNHYWYSMGKLGEMDMLLLKKIEELTLYVLELKNENEEIKRQFRNK